MDQRISSNRDILDDLHEFVPWGGRAWQRLVRAVLSEDLGVEFFAGREVLEIGTRNGEMAALFGLLGANVTGIDINADALPAARATAQRYGVDERVRFLHYDGDLNALEAGKYDLVFSKSVLVVVPDLRSFLVSARTLLKPDGRIAFIENAKGPWFIHAARSIRHQGWRGVYEAHFFTATELEIVRDLFHIDRERHITIPPIVSLVGGLPDGTV